MNTIRLLLICGMTQLMSSAVFSQASDPNQTPADPNQPAASKATFDDVLKTWSAGQKDQAVQMFLTLNWTSPDLFAPGSIFGIPEAEFVKMPEPKRAAVQQKAMEASTQIRELARYAVDQAKQSGQTAPSRQALLNCGKRLSGPDQLALIKMIARAITGFAEKELPAGR